VEPALEQIEQDQADLDHVGQVGLARLAALVPVRLPGIVVAGAEPIAVGPRRLLRRRAHQRGPELGMRAARRHALALRAAQGMRTPFSLSWTRDSPDHSFRVGTNARSARPARASDFARSPRPKPIASA